MNCKSCCTKENARKFFKNRDNILVMCTIISVFVAVGISIPIRTLKLDSRTIYCISMPGQILMSLLKMMIVPLLILSLLTGLTSLNIGTSGKMGLYTMMYYILTTFVAVCLGMSLVTVIHPGNPDISDNVSQDAENRSVDAVESVVNLFHNLFPDNIIRSTFQQVEIDFVEKANKNRNSSTPKQYSIKTSYIYATNFLGLIFFSIFFGIVVNSFGTASKPLVNLINLLNNIVMQMIMIIIYFMPVGIFFLILGNLLSIGNVVSVFITMGMFALTVLSGILIHSLIVLPTIFVIFARRNPFIFMWGMTRAMLVAFVTQSSSATIPVTMSCAESNNGIDPRITKFMLPIGAIINMDGTGLYEAVAAIFIAQINGINLGVGQLIRISLTSTLAAIGAATVPSAGLVTLLIVLSTAGLPVHQVGLLYSFDWFLDRCRTSINILGDAFGCGIVQRFCGDELSRDTTSVAAAVKPEAGHMDDTNV